MTTLHETLKLFQTHISVHEHFQTPSQKSFVVSCEREGTHAFTSQDFSGALMHYLQTSSPTFPQTINYKTPELRLMTLLVESKGYFCRDLFGKNLSKREYKIYHNRNSLKAPLAYALIRESCYTNGKQFIDPFCADGVVAIEAALYGMKKSPRFYEKDTLFQKPLPTPSLLFTPISHLSPHLLCIDSTMLHINAAKKNAKVAGVQDSLEFSRTDLGWLETKCEKGSVDCIATHLPEISHSTAPMQRKKLYDELFYQAEYILSTCGTIGLLFRNHDLTTLAVEEAAMKWKFTLTKSLIAFQGKDEMILLVYSKQSLQQAIKKTKKL